MLLSQLEALATSGSTRTHASASSLPSTQQLYSIGRVLYQLSYKEQEALDSDLFLSFQHLMDSLPASYIVRVLSTYQKATIELLSKADQRDELNEAMQAFNGIFTNAPRLCKLGYSTGWVSVLSAVYDALILQDAPAAAKDVVLSLLSILILDGLFLRVDSSGDNSGCSGSIVEEDLLEAIQAIEEKSTDCLGDLQAWQSRKEPFRRTIASTIQKLPPDTEDGDIQQQREYILSMLASARQNDKETGSRNIIAKAEPAKQGNKSTAKSVSSADEMERRIHQVKQILPDLGEGFIETALSLHQGNVETTVATLLNDPSQYPSALRALDRTLPRRRKHRSQEEAQESAEARQLVKERVALEQKQEEARYKALLYVESQQDDKTAEEATPVGSSSFQSTSVLHNEYDDDYDDQYDEIDIKLGGADDGMYDFEQVKLYNKLVRDEEAEDIFWQESRNTNRTNANASNRSSKDPEAGDQKQYRGPDKIKGGRVVGPDGKIVRKPGGARGKKNNKGNNNQSSAQQQHGQPTQPQKGKNRTKPKSNNRVNRQRDRKQKAQGTFGAQN